MIHSLLQNPDSPHARRKKLTGGYTYGLYYRERVLAVAQSTEGRAAKKRWDETLRGDRPNPGWTTRLGDLGRVLGITAVAVGKLLERLGLPLRQACHRQRGSGWMRSAPWDGYAMHDDWHWERVVSAIRSATQIPGKPGVADALAAAIAKQQGRERVLARRREQEETAAACRQEEEAAISALRYELQALRAADPGMTLFTAVEFVTSDPGRRVALYGLCSAGDRSIRSSGIAQDEACLLKIASSGDEDLALLPRRAKAEGFQI
jgi:hypothetical protein